MCKETNQTVVQVTDATELNTGSSTSDKNRNFTMFIFVYKQLF